MGWRDVLEDAYGSVDWAIDQVFVRYDDYRIRKGNGCNVYSGYDHLQFGISWTLNETVAMLSWDVLIAALSWLLEKFLGGFPFEKTVLDWVRSMEGAQNFSILYAETDTWDWGDWGYSPKTQAKVGVGWKASPSDLTLVTTTAGHSVLRAMSGRTIGV